MAVSSDGTCAASGGMTQGASTAEIILWDLDVAKKNLSDDGDEDPLIRQLSQHKGRIQALAFSPCNAYLGSLGGADDNHVLLWNLKSGKPIDQVRAGTDQQLTLRFCRKQEHNVVFVTAGRFQARVWRLNTGGNRADMKLNYKDVNFGNLSRVLTCVAIDSDDRYAILGTKTGDVIKVDMAVDSPRCPLMKNFSKNLYQRGVTMAVLADERWLLVGSGDGKVTRIDVDTLGRGSGSGGEQNEVNLDGSISSISPGIDENGTKGFYVGTSHANLYFIKHQVNSKGKPLPLSMQLISTGHVRHINDIAFHYGNAQVPGSSQFFLTCGKNDIRIWRLPGGPELLRIQVPQLECNCVIVSPQGNLIVSGWDDGLIRAFSPESGKLRFVITDAHPAEGGVRSLAMDDNDVIVSGGGDGRVRVWKLKHCADRIVTKMIVSHKDHNKQVTNITIGGENNSCAVSASDDGSCIIWDMETYARKGALMSQTNFFSVMYHPDNSQLLTCGSDRKLTYWDADETASSAIRMIDTNMAFKSIDIERGEGKFFVAGGEDCNVHVYDYDEGLRRYIGKGHSGCIKSIRISPCKKYVISVCDQGGIFVWRLPFDTC